MIWQSGGLIRGEYKGFNYRLHCPSILPLDWCIYRLVLEVLFWTKLFLKPNHWTSFQLITGEVCMCCDGERETTIWFQSLDTQRLFKWSWHLGSNYTTQYWSHYYALWSWENELAWNEEKVPALITGTSGHALPGISSPVIIFWIISDTSGKLFCSTKFYLKLTITTGFKGLLFNFLHWNCSSLISVLRMKNIWFDS